ncbi:WD40-like Beta Propeller [Melioribacter roseus P3M-2]|uniref:WD40-like Beta Propeller n=1 Tax=Melioribacter roseus (strain DSM 23840 / JCM 17771 / VKM B-2668 / P3M-2) TaxID=1191523 RepID=I6Z4U8_MELRP|nr:PD40 domain-containing protein [Melioribacter roseus]AFN74175.1 WD40-like Beta Propeller [Melioribacter roseus P3M-2]
MKKTGYLLLMVSLIAVVSCNKENPFEPDIEVIKKYEVVFVSDRNSGGETSLELGAKTELFSAGLDSISQKRLTFNQTWDFDPVYSPDGSKIAFTAYSSESNSNIILYDIAAKTQKILSEGREPVYSRDGSKIAFLDGESIGIVNSDGSNKVILDLPEGKPRSVNFSPDGARLIFVLQNGNASEIYSVNINGSDLNKITETEDYEVYCNYSPDGSRVVSVAYTNTVAQIFIMNSDGSNRIRLTNTEEWNNKPLFTPDGGEIIFVSNRNGRSEIFVMNSDGSNQRQLVSFSDFADDPVISSDGKIVAVTVDNGFKKNLWFYNRETGQLNEMPGFNANNFSPNFKPVSD